MLKPNDLTKAELLQVMEMLEQTAGYYLESALSQIERQRNDAHYDRFRKLIAAEEQHFTAYFDLMKPYEGRPLKDVPLGVIKKAQAELEKAQAAGKEWNRLNGIRR